MGGGPGGKLGGGDVVKTPRLCRAFMEAKTPRHRAQEGSSWAVLGQGERFLRVTHLGPFSLSQAPPHHLHPHVTATCLLSIMSLGSHEWGFSLSLS